MFSVTKDVLPILHKYENHRFSNKMFFFFFSRPEMTRNASAQQSCRYLIPLLSRAGENPIHFQLLYLLTVDPVSTHKGEGISSTHTLPVFIKHWVSITWAPLVRRRRGGRKKDTKRLSRANVDLRNYLLSLPASERIVSWSQMKL